MFWNSSAIIGYEVQASDGHIGGVSDLLFEDTSWAIRWLVVDTGHWLPGRKVLLPPFVLGTPDTMRREFPVRLTKAEVEASPDIDTDKSVSRQMEAHVYDYYGWDPYWGGGLYPVSNAMAVPFLAPLAPDQQAPGLPNAIRLPAQPDGDPHLRSVAALAGYHVHATDGEIGHIQDFIIDDTAWTIGYLMAETRNWWLGNQVLIPPRLVKEINWSERLFNLKVTREAVKSSPPYHPDMTINGAYDAQFVNYYPM